MRLFEKQHPAVVSYKSSSLHKNDQTITLCNTVKLFTACTDYLNHTKWGLYLILSNLQTFTGTVQMLNQPTSFNEQLYFTTIHEVLNDITVVFWNSVSKN